MAWGRLREVETYGRAARRWACVAGFWGATVVQAIANGGTFDTSDVWRTGNLEPVRQNKIQLAEETLKIVIDGEFAEVTVDYHLINRGGPTVLTYGFPVDVAAVSIPSVDKSLQFGIFDGGHALKVEKVLEKASPLPEKRPSEAYEGSTAVRKWHMVTLNFAPRETKDLEVRYRVKNLGQASGTNNDVFWGQSPREFLYALAPSATWGAGRVWKLTIIADLRKLLEVGASITKVSLPGYTEAGGVYRWELANFDLRKAPDLRITYDLGIALQSEEALCGLVPRSAIESIRVSSTREPSHTTQATYGAEHLLDRDFSTAWIEGARGPGVGEWIEVRFKKGTLVNFVGLANGYWKNSQRLAENGWIRKLRLDWVWGGGGKESETVDLKRPVYDAAMANVPYGKLAVLQEFSEMGMVEGLRSIRLTILAAEPGTKADDTAVSELVFGTENH